MISNIKVADVVPLLFVGLWVVTMMYYWSLYFFKCSCDRCVKQRELYDSTPIEIEGNYRVMNLSTQEEQELWSREDFRRNLPWAISIGGPIVLLIIWGYSHIIMSMSGHK